MSDKHNNEHYHVYFAEATFTFNSANRQSMYSAKQSFELLTSYITTFVTFIVFKVLVLLLYVTAEWNHDHVTCLLQFIFLIYTRVEQQKTMQQVALCSHTEKLFSLIPA